MSSVDGFSYEAWTLQGPRTGTGSPEGVVAAPVGTEYVDTAATNGAIKWIKATGTGNTGWRVLYGDTGVRNVTSLLTSTWRAASSTVTVTRTGDTVVLSLNVSVSAGTLLQWWPTILTLPQGFRPASQVKAVLPDTWLGWEQGPLVVAASPAPGGFVALETPLDEMTVPSGEGAKRFTASMMYPTTDPWPTVLPGTPA